jgi:ATP-binding protein involved in chromosome partitioning
MMGVDQKPEVQAGKIHPLEAHGVKLMSLGLIVERDAPAIWRGPIIMKVIGQFLRDVEWGQLDYFLVNLPPGTGDAQLSLAQVGAHPRRHHRHHPAGSRRGRLPARREDVRARRRAG